MFLESGGKGLHVRPVIVALWTDKDTIFENGGTASTMFSDMVNLSFVKGDQAATGKIFAFAIVANPYDLLFKGIKKALRVEGLKWDFGVNLLEKKCVAITNYVGSIRAGTAEQTNEAVIMWKDFSGCPILVTGIS